MLKNASDAYRATDEELAGVDLGLSAVEKGRFLRGKDTEIFFERFQNDLEMIADEPENSQTVAQRPGVYVATLTPYEVFYRVTDQLIEILHIQRI